MTTVIFCAAGNRRFGEIALRHGLKYGAQLPATIYHAPYFVDQNWREPVRSTYMAALANHHPALATVLDWERAEQRDEVLSWAEEAAQYVTDSVIIIPKVSGTIADLPRVIGGKPVRLGYSVPTKFAATTVPQWEFVGWPVHLLGGSPGGQIKHARYLNARSADGNYTQKLALQFKQFFTAGATERGANRFYPKVEEIYGHIGEDAHYLAFELSCMNLRAAWAGCTALIRYAVADDIPAVQGIAYQWREALGRVMRPALVEAAARRELIVAERHGQVVGFANTRTRRDGVTVVYEFAVDRAHLRSRIGTGLLAAVPVPTRLKVTADNAIARSFYEAREMCCIAHEAGKHRPLLVYESAATD